MIKLLKDKMNDNYQSIANLIIQNPELIEIKQNAFPNGDYAVTVAIEKRSDERNPAAMVLRSEQNRSEPDAYDIASLIENRFKDNKHFSPDIMRLANDMSDGISEVNMDFYSGIIECQKTIDTFKSSIQNNHILDVLTMRSELSDKGCDTGKVWKIPADEMHDLGQKVLLNYTDEDGKSALTKTSQVIDNILSKEGQLKIMETNKSSMTTIEKIKQTKEPEQKIKRPNSKKNKMI